MRTPTRPRRRLLGATAAALILAAGLSACSDSDAASNDGSSDGTTVRLGYFPNVTHATAIVGDVNGLFADELAKDGAGLETQQFNSGTDTIEALLSGSLDATYIGPSPTITAWAQSQGEAVRVIAGAASGGAALVVDPAIASVEDLEGKTIGSPDVGNTQDIALRYFLKDNGYETTPEGGGDVSVLAQDNAINVQAFAQGEIDGAWLPEPYASQIEVQFDGNRLVDESELWPNGEFVTTQLLVRQDFLDDHPDLVDDLLAGHLAANDFIGSNPEDAKQVVNDKIFEVTQTEIAPEVLDAAWEHLTFTNDPIASSLIEGAEHAEAVGLLDPVDLDGLYDLDPLNKLLAEQGKPEVSAS